MTQTSVMSQDETKITFVWIFGNTEPISYFFLSQDIFVNLFTSAKKWLMSQPDSCLKSESSKSINFIGKLGPRYFWNGGQWQLYQWSLWPCYWSCQWANCWSSCWSGENIEFAKLFGSSGWIKLLFISRIFDHSRLQWSSFMDYHGSTCFDCWITGTYVL